MPLSFSSFDPSSKKIIPLEDPSSKLKPKELKSLDKTVKVVAGESLLTEKSTADNSDAATDLKISAAASHDKSAKPSTLWNMIGRVFSVLESFFYESSSTPKTEASAESTPTNELSDDEPVVALAIDSPIKEEAISLQHSHDSSPLPPVATAAISIEELAKPTYIQSLRRKCGYTDTEDLSDLFGKYSVKVLRSHVEVIQRPTYTPFTAKYQEYMTRLVFLSGILDVYANTALTKLDVQVVITGSILADGLGDYYHIKNTAEKIKKAYPTWDVHQILDVDQLSERRASFPQNDPHTHLYGNYTIPTLDHVYPDGRGKDVHWKPEEEPVTELARDLLTRADIVLNMPCEYSPHILPDRPDILRIIEYGVEGFMIPQYEDALFMGVSPLQEGLLLPDPLPADARSLDCIAHAGLKALLLERCSDEKSYRDDTALFFGYVKRPQNYFEIACASCKALPQKFVDIIIPIHEVPSEEHMMEFYKEQGIKEISYLTRNEEGDYVLQKTLSVSPEGKSIRVIAPGLLSNPDVRVLMANSTCVGCTGDVSFSEALGGVFYYEIFDLKKSFFTSLIKLAKQVMNDPNCTFVSYLKATSRHQRASTNEARLNLAKEISTLMANPALGKQAGEFYQFIKDHYNFSNMVVDLVKRQVVHLERPEIKELERKLQTSYVERQLNLTECIQALRNAL